MKYLNSYKVTRVISPYEFNLRSIPDKCKELKCYLYDVLPSGGSLIWSWEALNFFKALVQNKECEVTINMFSHNHRNVPDCCGVVMILRESITDDMTVNALMVHKGFARPIGIMASSPSLLDIPGKVPSFDFDVGAHDKCKDFMNEQEPEEASKKQLQTIASVAMESHRRPRPKDFCPKCFLNHVPKPAYLTYPKDYLPQPIRTRIPYMNIQYVEGPHNIFVQMEDKRKEFLEMENEMTKEAKLMDQPSIRDLKPGSIITCAPADAALEPEDFLYRALVLSTFENDNSVRALVLDFGNVVNVRCDAIYQLPSRFRWIPSFVHRTHLEYIRPSFGLVEWKHDVCSVFNKYLISHNIGEPVYYVQRFGAKNIVEFSRIQQDVKFDEGRNVWVAEEADCNRWIYDKDECSVLNEMKDDPLVATFFSSFGVDILYEIRVDEKTLWDFGYISDFLIDHEHAVLVQERVDKDNIHQVMRHGCGPLSKLY